MKYNETISEEEAIQRLATLYNAKYNPYLTDLNAKEQLEICESYAETHANQQQKKEEENGDVNVRWNGNGGYKNLVNNESNWYKSELIVKLKSCKVETPEYEIASLLEQIFNYWSYDKKDHWLRIAQVYTPRVLNWVMSETIRKYIRGGIYKTPPAYFTYLLRYRTKRIEFKKI